MLLDRYSPMPYHHAMLNVCHLPRSSDPHHYPSQTPSPGHLPPWLRPTLNGQYKYQPRLCISQWATEMEITVRYGYAASIGSTSTDVSLNSLGYIVWNFHINKPYID